MIGLLLLAGGFIAATLMGATTALRGMTVVPLGLLLLAVGIEVLRRPFAGLLIWFAIVPLIGVRGVSPAFDLAYDAVYRLLTIGLVVLIFLVNLAERRSLKIGAPEIAIALYSAYVITSVLPSSQNLRGDLLTAFDRIAIPFAVYFLARHVVDRPERLRAVLIVMLLVALVQSAVAIAGEVPSVRGYLPEIWFARHDRLTGSLGNPVAFGTTLLVTLVLLNHLKRYHAGLRLRWMINAVSMVGAVTLALTFSRSVWIAAALVLLLSVVLHRDTVKSILPLVILTVVLLFSGLLAQNASYARERFSNQETIYGRIGRIEAGFNMVEIHPVLGWGYRQMDANYIAFLRQIPYFVRAEYVGGVSHNTLLTILVELGLVGLALHLLPIAIILRRSIRASRVLPGRGFCSRELVAVLWICVAVFFWTSSTMDMRYFPFALALQWFVLGLLASLSDRNAGLLSTVERARPMSVGPD